MRDVLAAVRQVADRQDRERRASGRGLAESLCGCHLHRLLLEHELRLRVTRDGDAGTRDDHDDESEDDCRAVDVARHVLASAPDLPDHPPGGDACHEGAGGEPGCGDGVGEGGEQGVVGQHRPDVVHLGAPGLGVEGRPDRVLHPRVRREDEEGREVGGQGDGPDAREVDLLGELVPPEDPQPEERRLDEEGGEGLHGERCAEDVTDEAGVLAPVHAELELLHDPGDHADREVDEEQLAEELGQLEPALVAGPDPGGLHDGDQGCEPDRQRYVEEVIDGGDGELPPCYVQDVHGAPGVWVGARVSPHGSR